MLKNIRSQIMDKSFLRKAIPIALSVWIISLTAYYCINAPWLSSFSSGSQGTKQLIGDTLKFQWVSVLLSRLPYVFYALILNFIALLMGNRILHWLRVDFDSKINKIVFSVPLGWSVYSIGIFYLGILGLLYVEVVYCFLTLLGILSILEIRRIYNITSPQSPLAKGGTEGGLQGGDKGEVIDNNSLSRFKIEKSDLIFLPIIITFITAQLVISFSATPSAVVYHMALPNLYIKYHALVHIPGSFFSTLPAYTDMLYLLGLITSGETLSRLFSFTISSIFLVSIFSVGNKYFSRGTGYLAIVITILSTPLFSLLFSEPYVDVALGLFSLLGVYAFFMWIEERKDGNLYLSIICCSFAAATKIHGLFFVLLFFAGFLVCVKMDKKFLGKLARCILIAGIITLPWYIRSWRLTGDPFFPSLYNYLGGKYWNEYSNACFWEYHSLPAFGGAKTFSDFIRITKHLFLSGFSTSSFSPIIVIFLIPAFITLWGKNKQVSLKATQLNTERFGYLDLLSALFFITFVYYMFFIFTTPQSRFFYVGLATMGIIVAHFIKTVWTKYLITRIPVVLCVAFSIVFFFGSVRWMEVPFFTGLGVLDQKQFLNQYTHWRVAMWIKENLPEDAKILSMATWGCYLDREYIGADPSRQGFPDFSKINDATTFLKSIKELGITHILYSYNLTPNRPFIRRVEELLNKWVLELFESGKIALIKKIDHNTIYSIAMLTEYPVLDDNIIKFHDKSHRKYLVKGWSSTEAWGTWSEGEESVILVNLREPKDYTMLIKATGFSVQGKQQSVRIYLDDNLLSEHTFSHSTAYFEDIKIKIPSAYIKEGNQEIRFVYSFPGSPAEHGMGPDLRQLAMGVSSIEFN